MKEIKFRAWDFKDKRMIDWQELLDYGSGFVEYLINPRELTFCEFTGLKDKNGKEIYEGDILKHDLWGNYEIVWEYDMFRGQNNEYDISLAHHQLKRSRVIGNIYENPELLKVK